MLGYCPKFDTSLSNCVTTKFLLDTGLNCVIPFSVTSWKKTYLFATLVSGSTIFKENNGDLKKNISLLRNN